VSHHAGAARGRGGVQLEPEDLQKMPWPAPAAEMEVELHGQTSEGERPSDERRGEEGHDICVGTMCMRSLLDVPCLMRARRVSRVQGVSLE